MHINNHLSKLSASELVNTTFQVSAILENAAVSGFIPHEDTLLTRLRTFSKKFAGYDCCNSNPTVCDIVPIDDSALPIGFYFEESFRQLNNVQKSRCKFWFTTEELLEVLTSGLVSGKLELCAVPSSSLSFLQCSWKIHPGIQNCENNNKAVFLFEKEEDGVFLIAANSNRLPRVPADIINSASLGHQGKTVNNSFQLTDISLCSLGKPTILRNRFSDESKILSGSRSNLNAVIQSFSSFMISSKTSLVEYVRPTFVSSIACRKRLAINSLSLPERHVSLFGRSSKGNPPSSATRRIVSRIKSDIDKPNLSRTRTASSLSFRGTRAFTTVSAASIISLPIKNVCQLWPFSILTGLLSTFSRKVIV